MSASVRECGSGRGARLRLLGALAVFGLPPGGCGWGCENREVSRVPSPYGRGAAVVFSRECGATTGFNAQVGIVRHVDAHPGRHDVVFVADDDHGAAPAGPGGGPEVRVRWIDGNHVEIAHHPRARTFRKETEHGSLRITYAALP